MGSACFWFHYIHDRIKAGLIIDKAVRGWEESRAGKDYGNMVQRVRQKHQVGGQKARREHKEEKKVSTWRMHREASCYSFLVNCTHLPPSQLSELFIVNDLFLLPFFPEQHLYTGAVVAAAPTALPSCLCTQRSPQWLSDKCTLIHNTCSWGLYIDSLIPLWPQCNMNSMLYQFKCVMTPARTGSTTYHIYDKAGPEKKHQKLTNVGLWEE